MSIFDYYAKVPWFEHAIHISAGSVVLAAVLTDTVVEPIVPLVWIFANYVHAIIHTMQRELIQKQHELIMKLTSDA